MSTEVVLALSRLGRANGGGRANAPAIIVIAATREGVVARIVVAAITRINIVAARTPVFRILRAGILRPWIAGTTLVVPPVLVSAGGVAVAGRTASIVGAIIVPLASGMEVVVMIVVTTMFHGRQAAIVTIIRPGAPARKMMIPTTVV